MQENESGLGPRKETEPNPAPQTAQSAEDLPNNAKNGPERKANPLATPLGHLLSLEPDRVLLAAGIVYGMGKPSRDLLDDGDRKLLMEAGQFLYALQSALREMDNRGEGVLEGGEEIRELVEQRLAALKPLRRKKMEGEKL